MAVSEKQGIVFVRNVVDQAPGRGNRRLKSPLLTALLPVPLISPVWLIPAKFTIVLWQLDISGYML
jgi:hypothetical protein